MPYIKSTEVNKNELNYDLSTETLFYVNFVLYTNINKRINRENLKTYLIETDQAHTQLFEFNITPSTCIECSLKKLNAGRIDGFIFGDYASDPYIKKYDLHNIHRELYGVFEVKVVLPKGGRQGELDNILSEGISKLKNSGEYTKIIKFLSQPYYDWQPTDITAEKK